MTIKFFEPNISSLELERVHKALLNKNLSDGSITGEFEDIFKNTLGYPYAVAFNSGTSALYAALVALGVGYGDEVIVTPYTFIASVHVVMLVGATPVFADIDRHTYNIDPLEVVKKLTPKTKAVIPVDVFGVPCDTKTLRELLPSSVAILEDSIEALGSTRDGSLVGFDVDAAVFGFSPNKQITTCEGGMLVTTNKQLHDFVRRFRQHGVKTGDPYYQMFGHNFRLTDIHAAIGCCQLERFNEIQGAVKNAERLLDVYFSSYRKQSIHEKDTGTLFVYVIELPVPIDKDLFIRLMADEGVPVKPYFRNLSELPHLSAFGYCPVAAEVGALTVALPTPYTLTSEQASHIYASFKKVLAL